MDGCESREKKLGEMGVKNVRGMQIMDMTD